jgi:hypothetical protein
MIPILSELRAIVSPGTKQLRRSDRSSLTYSETKSRTCTTKKFIAVRGVLEEGHIYKNYSKIEHHHVPYLVGTYSIDSRGVKNSKPLYFLFHSITIQYTIQRQ